MSPHSATGFESSSVSIARSPRVGEQKTVHVWRLYVRVTVEEELLREIRAFYRPGRKKILLNSFRRCRYSSAGDARCESSMSIAVLGAPHKGEVSF